MLDFLLVGTVSGHKNRCGHRLGALDPFGMVVCDFGGTFRFGQRFFKCFECPADRTDSHGRTVPPTVVRFRRIVEHPVIKTAAITGIGISATPFLIGRSVILLQQNRLGRGNAQHRIICKCRFLVDQRNFIRACCFVRLPFINRSANVADDGTKHCFTFLRCCIVSQFP